MSKVFVGMSGGVDSSVSAALLKEEGHDVTGVFIKVWHPEFLECNWIEERRDAMEVAAILDIPFKTLDLEAEYKKEVVDYMISEYSLGRTPNPDVMCNTHIKFGGFLDYAKSEGADYVATGHYAQNIPETGLGVFQLREGLDKEKDQSYFLWTLGQDQLRHALFPVGGLEKSKVRELAAKYGLPTAQKKDSQGLCFIGKVDMKEFLKRYIEERPGPVVNEVGDVVGKHDGIHFYTIGQRHGFEIHEQNPNRQPYFVVAKDIAKNILTVSHTPQDSELSEKSAYLKDVSWVSGFAPVLGNYEARIRYRGKRQQCFIESIGETVHVMFRTRQVGLSQGQSVVLYDGSVCLGGGVVK